MKTKNLAAPLVGAAALFSALGATGALAQQPRAPGSAVHLKAISLAGSKSAIPLTSAKHSIGLDNKKLTLGDLAGAKRSIPLPKEGASKIKMGMPTR